MGRHPETIRYHQMIDAGNQPSEKWCRRCETWLPLEAFGKDRSRKDGLAGLCRPCARSTYTAWVASNTERHRQSVRARAARVPKSQRSDAHRRSRYGLEAGEYDSMLHRQDGLCALCGRRPDKPLVVDHDHVTGRVRGLLCYTCNRSLHMFDEPGMLDAALRYLGRSPDGLEHFPAPERVRPGM